MKNIDEQIKVIKQGVSEIIQESDLIENLTTKKQKEKK